MTILAAIDGSDQANRIVPLAHDLAAAYDAPLVVLHVIPTTDYDAHKESLEDIPEFRDFSLNQEAASAKRFARRVVDETIESQAVPITYAGRVGDVAEEILSEAENRNPAYLVVSGKRRSPTGKAVFGDATQKILLNAECPVVTQMSD